MSQNSTESTTETNPGGSRGRALSTVWEFFIREKTSSSGHFSAKCMYCPAKWARGEPSKLEAHLALECPNVDDQVRQLYLLHVAHRNEFDEVESNILTVASKKQKVNKQSGISNFFPRKEEDGLSEGRINAINSSLLKAFVVCGIPFSAIENPFFIDFLQNL
ncbi:21623_t:CDS:1, partial [Racocetra persica]